jgi:hypothetical protein
MGCDVAVPDEPPLAPEAAPPLGLLPTDIVVVMVVMAPQAQLQAGQASPAGHSGQLQVQVPPPLPPEPQVVPPPDPPVPVAPPDPPAPVEPAAPPVPPAPQSHLQAGQVSPGRQAGQLQLQVPPPTAGTLSVVGGGGGQSQLTVGQLPLAGQAIGWTHPHPAPVTSRARQKPVAVQACPTGQRAGAVVVPCVAVQAHRVSPEQARESV